MARRYRGNKVENKRWEFNVNKQYEDKKNKSKSTVELFSNNLDNKYKLMKQKAQLLNN